jgi:hypothetical protein
MVVSGPVTSPLTDQALDINLTSIFVLRVAQNRGTELPAFRMCGLAVYLVCMSQQANCTDRATAACRRSDCQFLRIEGATWSA